MSDGTNIAIGKVSFTNIDIPGGLKAFALEDVDNGNTLTFIEVGYDTDEWAVKLNDIPELSYLSTAAAREFGLLADQHGIAEDALGPALRKAA